MAGLAEIIGGIANSSRPAQIRKHREDYNIYKTEKETSGEPALSFQEWLASKGIDPQKLLMQ